MRSPVRADPRRPGVLIGPGWMRIPTPMPDGGRRNLLLLYDLEDADLIELFAWHIRPDHQMFYAAASVPLNRVCVLPRGLSYVYMHQLLLGPGEGRVAHLNGNGLDNRRKNLARQEQAQILARRRPASHMGGKPTSSQYKGVTFDKETGKWLVQFRGKKVGRYRDELEAARAFDQAAHAHWGAQTYLNFPELVGRTVELTSRTAPPH